MQIRPGCILLLPVKNRKTNLAFQEINISDIFITNVIQSGYKFSCVGENGRAAGYSSKRFSC
jgi:hypothetical protein